MKGGGVMMGDLEGGGGRTNNRERWHIISGFRHRDIEIITWNQYSQRDSWFVSIRMPVSWPAALHVEKFAYLSISWSKIRGEKALWCGVMNSEWPWDGAGMKHANEGVMGWWWWGTLNVGGGGEGLPIMGGCGTSLVDFRQRDVQ